MGRANRLADSQSPYLQMHADNPVDWYPWGSEAFRKAREEDKPVFLSIGYATCHWCHVMAHESFEDPEVASLLNDTFVNIKVDREERPEIDSIYMDVCQMLTGRGGWPLTVVLTPDKQPFFAATYIPKSSRYGQKGMLDLIPQIHNLWEEERERVLNSAGEITKVLQQPIKTGGELSLDPSRLDKGFEQLKSLYDTENGGFGKRQKFPSAHHLLFLLRYWKRTGENTALAMVEKTLSQMRQKGLFDHVGYGFHRYSTDREWKVPHFEKMLYDQAMLAIAYTEAFQATGNSSYRDTAREIFTYVLREMTSLDGAFFSARDADTEGEEGKYYLWTVDEIREVLDEDHSELFIEVYNLSEEGNFQEEVSGERTGANIPYRADSLRKIAEQKNMQVSELETELERIRHTLFEHREKRTKPLLDDKILTDWNGMMIAALAIASRAFIDPLLAEDAEQAAEFILKYMRDDKERLLHMYRKKQSAVLGNLADYAFFIWGLLELYETTFKTEYLRTAMSLADDMSVRFWDNKEKGYFFTPDDGESMITRQKTAHDGAYPSGNSMALYVLIRLARLTGNPDYEEYARDTLNAFSQIISEHPANATMMLCGLDFIIPPSFEVVIAGEQNTSQSRSMFRALWSKYLPSTVVVFHPAGEDKEITQLAEYTKSQLPVDNKTTAYVCQNFQCDLPTTDIEKMLELLGEK